jgi:hypothetical protein
MVCDHVRGRRPDIIWVVSGKVEAAVCLACADDIEANTMKVEDSLKMLCTECAQIENIPTVAKMPDGFYEWLDGRWIQQIDIDAGGLAS